ncbi:MAG: 23S rRNA (guanosine(2251)-2'-O)-methyltransferase RlmB [Deltaproteobacteria bacterium]|jgi:23S rRNA (guanosine2251-2'-O)-methyltransferase|nr:23S rRNA (guanosine(2251)-2'-O)-methyltransferase RlmB [Deltaproteobacteria bacterium]
MSRIVFGVRPVEELCRARPREISVVYVAHGYRSKEIEAAVAVAKDRGIAVESRPRALVADLAASPNHQGMVAVAGEYGYARTDEMLAAAAAAGEAPLLLVLDSITDPQNLGALVRSAEVLGSHGVIVPDRHAAPVTGAAVKASAGASERMRIARVRNLLGTIDWLRQQGLTVWGGATDEEAPALATADLRGPVALVVGGEGRGLRTAVARRCSSLVRIPQRGQVASLNASVAGAILLYEAVRQRAAVV